MVEVEKGVYLAAGKASDWDDHGGETEFAW